MHSLSSDSRDCSPASEPRLLRYALPAAAATSIAIGTFWLFAWLFGFPQRLAATSIITMKTNAAVAAVLSGAALLLLSGQESRSRRLIGLTAAATVFAIGLCTLAEHVLGFDVGIDQLLFSEPAGAAGVTSPNRMGPPAAISFSLIGFALIGIAMRRRRIAPPIGVLVCVIVLFPAVGYVYRAAAFYGVANRTGIAWTAVIALSALGCGLLLSCVEAGPMKMFVRQDAGGTLLRHLFPMTLLVPIVLGHFRLLGENARLFDTATGTALLVTSLILVFSGLLWVSAARLSRSAAVQERTNFALRQSEERLRVIFDQVGVGIVEVNPDHRFIAANPRACEILGYSPEKLSTMTVTELTAPEDRPLSEQLNGAVQRGECDRFENEKRYLKSDGTPVWVRVTVSATRDIAGNYLGAITTVEDISERKSVEEGLRSAQWRTQTLAQVANDLLTSSSGPQALAAIFSRISEPLALDGFVHFRADSNEEVLRLAAYAGMEEGAAASIQQLSFSECICGLVAQQLSPTIVADVQNAADSKARIIRELGMQAYASFPLVANGTLIGTLSFGTRQARNFSDETIGLLSAICDQVAVSIARHDAQELLRASERDLRQRTSELESLLANAPIGLAFFDREHRFLQINERLVEINGLPAEAHIGRPISEVLPVNARFVNPVLDEVFAKGRTIEVEITGETPREPGVVRHWLTGFYPIFETGPEATRVGAYVVEITDRKRAELKLKEALKSADLERRRLSAVLDALPAGVGIADANGKITHFNAALTRIWGGPPTPSSTHDYIEFKGYWPDTGQQLRAHDWAIARALSTGEVVPGEVVEIEKFDGTGRATIINSAAPIRDNDGHVVGGVVAEVDITSEKRTMKALEESERRYRWLFESMLNGVAHCRMIYDEQGRASDFVYLYVNPAFEKLTGRTRVSGKTYKELFPGGHELNPELLEIYGRVVATGQSEKFEINFKALGHWYSVTAYRTEPDHFVHVFENITEQKNAQEKLRESERRVRAKLDALTSPEGDVGELELADIIDVPRLQALFEDFHAVTHMPVAVIDLGGNILVGAGWQDICTNFHRVNPVSCEHCIESDSQLSAGIPAGQYKVYQCKNHMWDVATPIFVGKKHVGNVFTGQFFFEDETPDIELFREQARTFNFPEKEYVEALSRVPRLSRNMLENGMAYLMKLADMISKLSYSNLELARSLGERSRLTAALRQSESRLRAVAENIPEMVWVADAGAEFVYLSPKWLRYTGSTAEQNANGGWVSAIHPEDRASAMSAWNTAVSSGSDYESEYRLRRSDGEFRLHLARAVPMPDVDSGRMLWFGITTDIQDQKQAQQALIRNEKLASAGRMAATVAHEINNPLATLTNLLFLLRREVTTDTGRQYLSHAESQLAQVGQITRRTLGFYRDSARPTRFKLADLLDEILGIYSAKIANNDISTNKEYTSPGEIEALPGELRQVFANLVANAIDAMPQGGTLNLRICSDSNEGRPRIKVQVQDSGVGIVPENQKKIFEPFFTTKEDVGTGLGLWVVKEILKRHGGTVELSSSTAADDHGTCFSVCLPVNWEFRLV